MSDRQQSRCLRWKSQDSHIAPGASLLIPCLPHSLTDILSSCLRAKHSNPKMPHATWQPACFSTLAVAPSALIFLLLASHQLEHGVYAIYCLRPSRLGKKWDVQIALKDGAFQRTHLHVHTLQHTLLFAAVAPYSDALRSMCLKLW